MNSEKKKSRKRSDANLGIGKPPDPLIFFLDRSIGKYVVAEALRNKGIEVKLHDDIFAADAEDVEWLSAVGNKGWIVLTKDKNIKYRRAELDMVKKYKVRMFTFSGGNLKGTEMAEIFINALSKIKRFINKTPPPFIVIVTRTGNLSRLDLSS